MRQLLLLFCILPTLSYSQVQVWTKSLVLPTDELGRVQFQEVISLADSTQPANQIITRCRSWAAKTYNNSEQVVQQYDPQSGVLIIKGVLVVTTAPETKFLGTTSPPQKNNIQHTLTLEAKKGRYRATINQLSIMGYPIPVNSAIEIDPKKRYKATDRLGAEVRYLLLEGIQNEAEGLLYSLEKTLNKKEKDW